MDRLLARKSLLKEPLQTGQRTSGQLRGLEERCKLLQRGAVLSPGRKTHIDAFTALKTHLATTDFQHYLSSLDQQFATRKKKQFVFLLPSHFFSGSILPPPVNGVDAPGLKILQLRATA